MTSAAFFRNGPALWAAGGRGPQVVTALLARQFAEAK
jgi:hypothetical protein